ncbi:hypothetical protein IEE84_03710 [Psychrobacter sp. 28M-43]|uniref:hypothetical protein n=1 Tax=Psychrobacter sp. 28M-43 TaxID=2772254 RepID=UPI00168D8729|nr:hypothetical protein [Psychrobacter sp. 28M-43]QOD13394.1 hypothetical protein IEE84_03710 [Psychrobacter sp. 28M-43]
MDIILAIVWILAMVLYSFSSDYVASFPNHNNRVVPYVRWGALLVAMALSAYLSKAYQENLQGNGMWVFIIVVFVVIVLAKVVFKWVINRRLKR